MRSYGYVSMEKLAGDLLFGTKFVKLIIIIIIIIVIIIIIIIYTDLPVSKAYIYVMDSWIFQDGKGYDTKSLQKS